MHDPFAPISPEVFNGEFLKYPALKDLFDLRMRRLVNRGMPFFELPRIYQWIVVGGPKKKLKTLDSAISFLSSLRDSDLDRKIKEVAKLTSDPDIFRYLTEFLVIYRILQSDVTNFKYEELLGEDIPKFDINLDFMNQRIRIEVTHKEDVYSLEDTAKKLKINLRYANPSCGGEIEFAPPLIPSHHGDYTESNDMSDEELKVTITNALNVMESLKSGSAVVPCPSPSFQIILQPNTGWIASSSGTWYRPNILGYFKSIHEKAKKSLQVSDDSYKIIAVNFVPSSDFHDDTYREQLRRRLLDFDLTTSSNIDEIFTFSMRFESGKFDTPNLLWKRESASPEIFIQLAQ